MITVYGRTNSANVQLVMWAIHEMGLDCERIDYGIGHASPKSPEYLAKNPMGLVPVLEDGDQTLWESAAILRYLGATYGDDTFWPSDPAKRAALDVWAEWGKNTFAVSILNIFVDEVRVHPDDRRPETLAKLSATAAEVAGVLDTRLADRAYIGGDNLTFADIATAHILYRYYTLDWPRPDLEHLAAYYERLQDRAAYRDHVMVSYDNLRGLYPKPDA